MLLAVILYLPVLVFGTHFVRTLAFNRHEAVTFECSSITTLIALLLIWQYGPSRQRLILCAILLVMFIANAFTQWHFYMRLQDIIETAFSKRTVFLEKYLKKEEIDRSVIDSLKTMASVAIMPSFSRFIEESKYFNNPGNLIGLIKSIMKRQRFQKKKYLMRECFAEILNLIGPCKPDIDSMMKDDKFVVPGTIQANDLALEGRDEVKGLVTYDVLGFGAHIIVFLVLLDIALHGTETVSIPLSSPIKAVLMMLSALIFTAVSHTLRHFGFARYESFCYELSFTGLVVTSFRLLAMALNGQPVKGIPVIVMILFIAVFLLLSFCNKRMDKELHTEIKDTFKTVIEGISFDTETDRIKRRILKDLDTISEWSIVPYSGRVRKNIFPENSRLGKFEEINSRKRDMPRLTAEFVKKVVPEYDGKMHEECFRLDNSSVKTARTLINLLGTAAFIALFILIGYGWI